MTITNSLKLKPDSRFAPYAKPILTGSSLCVSLALFVWALLHYQPVNTFYGPRAIYSLMLLSVLLALSGRFLLLRLLKAETRAAPEQRQRLREEWQPIFLFDITAPVYLAAAVLIGVPAAIITTIVTQVCLHGYTYLRGYVSLTEASYRVAAMGLLMLVAGFAYTRIASSPPGYFTMANLEPSFESSEFLGSILAAAIILCLIALVSLPVLMHVKQISFKAAWYDYMHSPTLRFQALVLSVGPLMPVVDIFDNVAAELAWAFFLVPLFAIYYLALISTRLSIRTAELQRTLEDLSSTRRRRDELYNYASLITRVQEEERRRLSRELHDDTAQALIALSLGLDGVRRAMGKQNLPEKDVQWLDSLQNLAESTLDGVRRACRDLRPSVLDDLGLRAALEWLSDTSASRGVPCTFACVGTPRSTTQEAEIAIFRIVQEAFANIWRHSSATEASLRLHYWPGLLQVTVTDNGHGFANDQQFVEANDTTNRGLGLRGMRERATLVGAQLTINAVPGTGCTIAISLSL